MNRLIDAIAAELERPRALTAQVLKHLASAHAVGRDEVADFFKDQLAGLEDFEIDLILSPLFTPSLAEQAVFGALLQGGSVPKGQWGELVEHLLARPVVGSFVLEDGSTQSAPLREVTVERYVHRLRLEASLDDVTLSAVHAIPWPSIQPLIIACARRAIWDNRSRLPLLQHLLRQPATSESDLAALVTGFLSLMEAYQPADAAALVSRLDHVIEVTRQQALNLASPKPFFSVRIQDMHGGGRDQRSATATTVEAREQEMRFLQRLRAAFAPEVK